jgi:hypothetical protein
MDSINWSDIYIISHLSLLKVYKKVGIRIKHNKNAQISHLAHQSARMDTAKGMKCVGKQLKQPAQLYYKG